LSIREKSGIFKSRGLQLPMGATHVNRTIPLCRRFKLEIPPPRAIIPKAGIEEGYIPASPGCRLDWRLMIGVIYVLIGEIGILYGRVFGTIDTALCKTHF
jgi:hypothetical protein